MLVIFNGFQAVVIKDVFHFLPDRIYPLLSILGAVMHVSFINYNTGYPSSFGKGKRTGEGELKKNILDNWRGLDFM